MQLYKEKDDNDNFRLPRKAFIDLRKCTSWKVWKIDNSKVSMLYSTKNNFRFYVTFSWYWKKEVEIIKKNTVSKYKNVKSFTS